jgi:ribosome-associated toxin RatA of RatAB toxin-antitoxin module
MPEVTQTAVLEHDIATVWSALADFGGIYKFHPRVARSPLLGDRQGGIGARRRCEFVDGSSIEEEVVQWTEGRSLTVDIVKGSMPLHEASGRIELEPLSAGTTRISFALHYVPKYGPVGWLMNVMMMRREFGKLITSIIEGLDTHLRTGSVIDEHGEPVPAAA